MTLPDEYERAALGEYSEDEKASDGERDQRVIPNKHNRCMSGDILKSPSNFNHGTVGQRVDKTQKMKKFK